MTRFLTLLWHRAEPIGICVFVAPPLSLSQRNRYFGRRGIWNRAALQVLNRSLVLLQRVVLHPTYRGGGIAAAFVRRSCELCRWPWIETLTQLGHIHPLFERAGFVRVGTTRVRQQSRRAHSAIYGGRSHARQKLLSRETFEKSRYASPVYYIFDNRAHGRHHGNADSGCGDAERTDDIQTGGD